MSRTSHLERINHVSLRKHTLRRVLLTLVVGLSPLPAQAGPICRGFWDCLPFTVMLFGAFAVLYGSPVVFTITFAVLLYARLRKRSLSATLRAVLIVLLLLSSMGVFYGLYMQTSNMLARRRNNLDRISDIQRDGLQIYKITNLRRPYFVGLCDLLLQSDVRRVVIEIGEADKEDWAYVIQHLATEPGTSPDCPDRILGQARCPLFGATPGGTPVYWVQRDDKQRGGRQLMISKGTTAISFLATHEDWFFSDADLADLYEMVDSLTPVTTDELRSYHRELLDNLKAGAADSSRPVQK